ncbi:alcohol oxidase [Coprinellus micaceus]|uniref:pyranose dehydrogenase (acceptor) n=1 Tax=Coprinellus micaceus TaxID=71717 RepID=A0A4Y7TK51_COPMI|nr:alcohol oxidase [Coprinellus micaceus]
MSSLQENTFDIIFVGGGAAGSVAAGKLAAANPDLRILILEAGPHSLDVERNVQPVRYMINLLNANKEAKNFTLHISQPTEAVANRQIVFPAGRVLGGGSSVNFMVYTRASASDYDGWEKDHGNPGWGSEALIPLLKEIETYCPRTLNSTHGTSGPLKISFADGHTNVAAQFLDVVEEYDQDRRLTEDWNDFKEANAYGIWAKYINNETGRRSDTAHNFLYNQSDSNNIVIRTESRAIRVLFEGTCATGVEYVVVGQEVISKAHAAKLVVLSSGAFASPAILERSGIGSEQVLRKHGIEPLVDLPGVGENFNDHSLIFTYYSLSDEAETIDHILQGSVSELQEHVQQWRETGKGLIAHNGLNAGFKLRPSPEDRKKMGPAFEKRWNGFYALCPDKPVLVGGPVAAWTSANIPRRDGKYMNLLYCSMYPASTGSVHITSALDPYHPLNFYHGYFEDDSDLAVFQWAYKHLREVARRMPFYRGEIQDFHPAFPEGSEAACKAENMPVAPDAPKIAYSAEDDAAIDDYHRRTIKTAWHALGTCAMKPREKNGVVDSRLNVYGTKNLKVADLSICPDNVGANTYNTALAVGSKAAVLIAEDLGLKLKHVVAEQAHL